jgi:hypothetical protein
LVANLVRNPRGKDNGTASTDHFTVEIGAPHVNLDGDRYTTMDIAAGKEG